MSTSCWCVSHYHCLVPLRAPERVWDPHGSQSHNNSIDATNLLIEKGSTKMEGKFGILQRLRKVSALESSPTHRGEETRGKSLKTLETSLSKQEHGKKNTEEQISPSYQSRTTQAKLTLFTKEKDVNSAKPTIAESCDKRHLEASDQCTLVPSQNRGTFEQKQSTESTQYHNHIIYAQEINRQAKPSNRTCSTKEVEECSSFGKEVESVTTGEQVREATVLSTRNQCFMSSVRSNPFEKWIICFQENFSGMQKQSLFPKTQERTSG